MKKSLLISMLALLLVGCWQTHSKEEPKNSVAKEATWDIFLLGSWRYNEDASPEKSDYPQGIETFFGDGTYICYTENKKGEKVIINGTWRLDDEEDFIVWVTQQKVETANKTICSSEKKFKCIINSLTPESSLVYQMDDTHRSAEWVENQ